MTCTTQASCVNVLIGVLVVHCELHVNVRVHVPLVVCDDAAIDLTLVLIALVIIVVFVVAIFHRILLYWTVSFTLERGEGRSSRLYLHAFCALTTVRGASLRRLPPPNRSKRIHSSPYLHHARKSSVFWCWLLLFAPCSGVLCHPHSTLRCGRNRR